MLPAWIVALAQTPAQPSTGPDVLVQILQFVYTIAHSIGQGVVGLIQRILPQANIPGDLVDPIGFLSVLTVFVVLAGVARKIAWLIVVVGWLLIVVRVVLAIMGR